MKIAILLDNVYAEGEPYPKRMDYQIKTLVEYGFEVDVYCKNDENVTYPKRETRYGATIYRVFTYYLGTTVDIHKYIITHQQLIDSIEDQYDIYHCVDTMTWPVGYLLSQRDGAKFICDSLEYFPDYIPKEWHKNNLFKYEITRQLLLARGKYIEYADYVIVVSEEMALALYEEYNLKNMPQVIYNTRPTDIERIEIGYQIKNKYMIDKDKKIFLFQGIVEYARGVDIIINIMKYIEDGILVIAGDGEHNYIKQLKQLVCDLNIQSRVIFTGFLSSDTLMAYTLQSDYNVYLPRNIVKNIEVTLPNKLFDYILAKKPIIVSDVLALKNKVNQYDLGMVIDTNDTPYNNASKIMGYINSEGCGIKEINIELTWEGQVNKLVGLYEGIEKEILNEKK